MEKKLQVRSLRISFRTVSGKVQAVRGISFDLFKGETLAIVGESGSGKSVTSKAILGIQAGNSIVEGGEVLYDGQDLLRINEADFYKLRGDKIAMIFQDPLSSLNPIMRIGKQLTEAMILKGRTRQKASKQSFRTKLKLLEKYMSEANSANMGAIKEKCAMFRKFVTRHMKMESKYNTGMEYAEDAISEIENILFLIEKNSLKDADGKLRKVKEMALGALNPYLVGERAPELKENARALTSDIRGQVRQNDYAPTVKRLTTILKILQDAVQKERPDFFAMGYYLESGERALLAGTIAQNNAKYAEYLENNYMREFTTMAQDGVEHADNRYGNRREKALVRLNEALERLREGKQADWTPKALEEIAGELCTLVNDSIDPIDIVKDSAAYTFESSLKAFVKTYAYGTRTNARKNQKYQNQLASYQRKLARGKKLDYKVPQPSTIDLELVRENILNHISGMAKHYEERIAADKREDKRAKTERLIDYLKDNASGMVQKITKRAAKNKALKLMEEVGIDDVRRRYRQYPFEFSGGMRQRIVIAIALAANPDILICDEPTTALDVTIQAQILELINKIKRKRDLSIIFITHDLGVVANMADRIAVMYAGKIVEYGTSQEVFYSPAHPYTWALLTSMPDLDTKEKLEAIPGTPPNMIYPPKGDAFAERSRYAMKIDFELEPPSFKITDTHWAATWLLHPNAPKTTPPKSMTDRIEKMKARLEGASHA